MRSYEKRQLIWANSSPHRKFEDGIRYVMQPGGPGAPGNWVNLETASDSELDDMLPTDERPRPPRERPNALPPSRDRLSPGEYDRQARQARAPEVRLHRAAEHERERIINLEQSIRHLEQRVSHLEDVIEHIIGIADVWRDRWSPADEE